MNKSNFTVVDNATTEDSCTILMDGIAINSNDFVAVLSKDNGDASFYISTDAVTLGMAIKLLTKAFVDCLMDCSEEECEAIKSILEGSEAEEKEDAHGQN